MPKRGRPRIHNDSQHKDWREARKKYYNKNRKVVSYANSHNITIREARRHLKIRKPRRKK